MMEKTWVLLKFNDGTLKAWADYGDVAWGSPLYTVLDYFTGSYRDAMHKARGLA